MKVKPSAIVDDLDSLHRIDLIEPAHKIAETRTERTWRLPVEVVNTINAFAEKKAARSKA